MSDRARLALVPLNRNLVLLLLLLLQFAQVLVVIDGRSRRQDHGLAHVSDNSCNDDLLQSQKLGEVVSDPLTGLVSEGVRLGERVVEGGREGPSASSGRAGMVNGSGVLHCCLWNKIMEDPVCRLV